MDHISGGLTLAGANANAIGRFESTLLALGVPLTATFVTSPILDLLFREAPDDDREAHTGAEARRHR